MKSIQNNNDLISAVDTVVAILMAEQAGLSTSDSDMDTAEQLVSIIDDYTSGKGWDMVYDKIEEIAPMSGDLIMAQLPIDDDFITWVGEPDDDDFIITDDEYDIDDLDDDDLDDDSPYLSEQYADLEW